MGRESWPLDHRWNSFRDRVSEHPRSRLFHDDIAVEHPTHHLLEPGRQRPVLQWHRTLLSLGEHVWTSVAELDCREGRLREPKPPRTHWVPRNDHVVV